MPGWQHRLVAAPLLRPSVPGIYRRGSRQRAAGTMAEARSLKAHLNADVIRGEYREQSRMRGGPVNPFLMGSS